MPCSRLFFIVLLGLVAGSLPGLEIFNDTLGRGNPPQGNDSRSMNWDLRHDGSIYYGTNNLFSNALRLQVGNNSNLSVQRQGPSSLNSDWVCEGTSGTLRFQRRINLFSAEAVARYIEIIHNPGPQTQTVELRLNNNLGGSISRCHFIDGDDIPRGEQRALDKGTALLATRQDSRRPVFFHYLGAASRQCQISVRNDGGSLQTSFQFELPELASVAVVHVVAQRTNGSEHLDEGTLAFLAGDHLYKDLPEALLPIILNRPPEHDEPLIPLSLAEWDLPRGEGAVLGRSDGTALSGTVKLAAAVMHCPPAKPVSLAVDELLALERLPGDSRYAAYRRDGQILVGELQAERFRFSLGGGFDLLTELSQLHRLLFADSPASGEEPAIEGFSVTLASGMRLRLRQPPPALQVLTPWGSLRVDSDELEGFFRPINNESFFWQLHMRGGSKLPAVPVDELWHLDSELLGALSLPPAQVTALLATPAPRSTGKAAEPQVPRGGIALHLGKAIAVGTTDLEVLHFDGLDLPLQRIAACRIDSYPACTVELWSGQQLTLRLRPTHLPLRCAGKVLQIPLAAVNELLAGQPVLAAIDQDRALHLLGRLGEAAWETRDKAHRELASFGLAVVPLLERHLDVQTDEEVRHRLRLLIDGLQGPGRKP